MTNQSINTIQNSKYQKYIQNSYYVLAFSRSFVDVLRCSLVSDCLQLHGLQPTTFLCPWDFPGKNTGVGSYFLTPGHLPNPGIEPASPVSPALAGGFLITEPPGKLMMNI